MASENATLPATTASALNPRSTVALLMLVVACAHFNRVGMAVVGNERIIPDYGIEPDKMGLVYSAFLLFYTLAMLPGGWLIDRFGPRLALALLLVGSTVFVGLTGAVGFAFAGASALWLGLIVVRSLLGIFNAPLHPASARMVSLCVPAPSRALANGWVTFAACVGIASTQLVLGSLMDRFGWAGAMTIASGSTLLVALIFLTLTWGSGQSPRSAATARARRIDRGALWIVLKQPSVIAITLSYTAYGYFQYLFFYWLSYYFETIQHQDRMVTRGYSTQITLAMGVGMLCGGWLADRLPQTFSHWARRALVPMFGMFASGVTFEIGLLADSPQAMLAAFVISAAILGACEAAFWTTAVELGGVFGGTAAALMNTGGNAGGTLSPYLTPLLSKVFADRYGAGMGWRLSLAVAGMIAFAGGLLWWCVQPPANADER
jgi:MFS transporter, ACS family, D-galactonate transporter